MHVKARMMALGGLFLALCVICMVLGSVIETSTLFFLAGASYFVGIVVREMGMKMGAAFYLAAVILGFLLAPNKFYVVSFAAMGLYILAVEGVWRLMVKGPERLQNRKVFWAAKYGVFNILYIPSVLLFREILFPAGAGDLLVAGVLLGGQVMLWIYDNAYEYVQARMWNRLRRHLWNTGN